MSSVGRMDGAFFVSRTELLGWANATFLLNLTKVEQCANGAVYCQIIDSCHPGTVAMKKVNWAARADHESIPNFKVLQQAFDRCGIQRHIEVDKLVRGKYQDNLEMLQWIKTYFDRTFPGGEYDAMSRRFTEILPDWARPAEGPGSASRGAARGPSNPTETRPQVQRREAPRSRGGPAGARGAAAHAVDDGMKEEHEKLREEVVDLKITVDGLETERDFYFQKLRDIEILCQALEANPDPHMTVAKFVEDVQRILYAKDEDDAARDDEQQYRPRGGAQLGACVLLLAACDGLHASPASQPMHQP
eukprot:CAMPEP_0171108562 /NCGR_PEP_ID=MMETSP0766_2-20121228/69173_1 /TAXON_ID=439317 /ORGANISM="Gambierdiscus australes, Strain CAWD 149" /LENGTH=303 /DNA_ID=CAMNT_0011570121 /DNA_START=74 /DNA_END=982 /DNA_ORIENTATION=+